MNLLTFKKNVFSQNGEDGVIDQIFELIGPGNKACCEFGAWDGIHFSNTRNLILSGWTGIMIEGDGPRFKDLVKTYGDNDNVHCINRFVDDDKNSLSAMAQELGLSQLLDNLDFLSIDIDGLDYEIFEGLDIFPRVICIEVNAGHSPATCEFVERDIAKNNVGQPLYYFTEVARKKGYKLLCYSGNAFYIREDVREKYKLPEISNEEAYKEFLDSLDDKEREWLFLVNKALVEPYHKYDNPYLSGKSLEIESARMAKLALKSNFYKTLGSIRRGWWA